MRKSIRTGFYTLLATMALSGCSGNLFSSRAPVELQEVWASDNTLRTPESALFDPQRNVIYVSNMNSTSDRNDGDGFISRLDAEGNIEDLYWVTGLNNPAGMALHNNVLYVADADEVVAIATQSGSVLGKYKAEKAKFLNDVAVDDNGTVYVTDSEQRRIYQMRNGRISTWIENTKRENPNGIFIEGDRMMVAFFNSGHVRLVDPGTKDFTDWTDGIKSADGIARLEDGNYLISSWDGEVYYVNQEGRKWRVLDTKSKNVNAADISYARQPGLLLVPTFRDNRVVAYRLKGR